MVPTSTDNVIIAIGHTVAVNNGAAVCNNIFVEDATAKLDMRTAASLFKIYGNFTIAVTTHAAFSNW